MILADSDTSVGGYFIFAPFELQVNDHLFPKCLKNNVSINVVYLLVS